MNLSEQEQLWDELFVRTKNILESAPGCHDFEHIRRVCRNADMLLATENPNEPFAVRIAALLHDIARPEELASEGKICHASEGAPKAEKLLRECGCNDDEFIYLVRDCVKTHRYRGSNPPLTLEGKIVYDADKLDSTGAFGVARAFHFAGRTGAVLHNTYSEALASKEYERGDSAYREYLVKLRHIHEKMLTESGRRIAHERYEFMRRFFEELNNEAGLEGQLL